MATDSSKMNRKEFLQRHQLSEDEFATTGLDWSDLDDIRESHALETPNLHATANHVTQLLQQVAEVHSLKVRIKDTEELVERIIRMKLENPTLTVSRASYREQVTDLIGIRAVYLFRDQWKPIHEFVTKTWDLGETPKAYVREGDPDSVIQVFRESGCDVQQHPLGYRSVRYLLQSRLTKYSYTTELHVRTIFEEGYTEIDRQVHDPRAGENPILTHFIATFNRLSASADEMGSFIKTLSVHAAEQTRRQSDLDNRLRQTIKQLNISDKEKNQLQQQVDDLRREGAFPKLTPDALAGFKWSAPAGLTNELEELSQEFNVMAAEPKAVTQAPANGPKAAPQGSPNGPKAASQGPAKGQRGAFDAPSKAASPFQGPIADALNKTREAFEIKTDRRICSRCGQPFVGPPGFEMAAQPVCADCLSR